jgi:hypothetical protein
LKILDHTLPRPNSPFKINLSKKITPISFKLLDMLDFRRSKFSTHDGSFISSVNMDLYKDGSPIILACQHGAENTLFSFVVNIKTEKFKPLKNPLSIHKGRTQG